MNPKTVMMILRAIKYASTDEGANVIFITLATVMIIILMILSLPLSLFMNKDDGFLIDRTDYENIANTLNMQVNELIVYNDILKYDNEIENIEHKDILRNAFDFIEIEVREYEYVRVVYHSKPSGHYKKYKRKGKTYYIKKERRLKNTIIIKTLSDYENNYGRVSNVKKIETKLIEFDNSERNMFEYTLSQNSFNNVISPFDIDKQNYVKELLATDIFESTEATYNIYDRKVDFNSLKTYDISSGNNISYFSQTDKRWASVHYGNSTIYSGGCGPTALAMVVNNFKDSSVTPVEVANWSYQNGHRAEGQGSYWSLMTEGGRSYGFNVITLNKKEKNKIVQQLKSGYTIIVAMGPGQFTRNGHFIVLTGIKNNSEVLVNDSASQKRTQQTWDIETIIKESSRKNGGNSFWVFKP